jgi:serine/threonine-protein kinase RsbW
MTSNAIRQNEPNQSSFISDCQIQKPSVLFKRVIPSDPTFLDDAVDELRRAIDGITFWGDLEDIDLAVREVLANAIIHGNHSDPEKSVSILVAVNKNCDLFIVVKDSGSGFDPSRVLNPTVGESLLANHGRGIFLIRQFMDQVFFRFNQGTEVVMQRRCQWLRSEPWHMGASGKIQELTGSFV